ncbi:MAG: B12-binding domain-containing radical SAM protein, partial [Candidatus Hinthialibacter sp.]
LLLEALDDQKPDLIILYFDSPCFGLARFLTQKIKQKQRSPVVWAGADSTFHPAENMRYADIVCIGESEYPIRFLVDRLDQKQDYTGVPSLWMQIGGEAHQNPMLHLEDVLDRLPWPDFDTERQWTITGDRIQRGIYPSPSAMPAHVPIAASRSCPFTCPQCGAGHDGLAFEPVQSVRLRSVSSVLDELKFRLQTWHRPVERIEFRDDSMPLEADWLAEFVDRYPTEIAMPCFGKTRAHSAGLDEFRMLRQAGMFAMILQIPAGGGLPDEVRESLLQTAHHIHEAGMKLLCEIKAVNPIESEADHMQTLQILHRFPKGFGVVNNIPFSFSQNCAIYQEIEKKGLLDQFEQPAGEHAFLTKNKRDLRFWDCLYKLVQFEDINGPCLTNFVQDDYMRQHLDLLEEMVHNLYQTIYVNGNPVMDKDRHVQSLRTRLMESKNIASEAPLRCLQKWLQPLFHL